MRPFFRLSRELSKRVIQKRMKRRSICSWSLPLTARHTWLLINPKSTLSKQIWQTRRFRNSIKSCNCLKRFSAKWVRRTKVTTSKTELTMNKTSLQSILTARKKLMRYWALKAPTLRSNLCQCKWLKNWLVRHSLHSITTSRERLTRAG